MKFGGRRVLIGTPAHDFKTFVHFTHAYGETIRMGQSLDADVRGLFLPGEAIIQKSRNELIKAALQHEFNDLIFIDSDQEWQPEWVFELLRHPVDCVGLAVRKKEDAESYNVKADSPDIPIDPETGLMVVKGLGTGFLRLTKQAMLALWNRSEEYRDDQNQSHRWIFDIRPINGRLVSEDIQLAAKLKDAGISVYLDPRFTCSHLGVKKYTGDFARWLQSIQ